MRLPAPGALRSACDMDRASYPEEKYMKVGSNRLSFLARLSHMMWDLRNGHMVRADKYEEK